MGRQEQEEESGGHMGLTIHRIRETIRRGIDLGPSIDFSWKAND